MQEFVAILFIGVLAFASMHYTLGIAKLSEPARAVLAVIFAVLVVLFSNPELLK